MAKCANCQSRIFVGGVRDGELVFCNTNCHQECYLAAAADTVPPEIIQQETLALHLAACPLCGGPGPNHVYAAHRVYSALVVTRYESTSYVCCAKCARKKHLGATALSFFLGWWGFPWGVVMTPVQISRNIAEMTKKRPKDRPSPELEKAVRRRLGAQVLQAAQRSRPPVAQR